LFVEPRSSGAYTLDSVGPNNDVALFATGTGEAPHNAMLAELLTRGHAGRIINATCVRWQRDLAYAAAHRQLERRYPNYRYLTLTTREPENLDASHPRYVGKQYLQQYVQSDQFEQDSGLVLDPARVHVFLCGSPAMIGAPVRQPDALRREPQPGGMLDVLHRRGFTPDEPGRPGNVHFERYW
jgi:ferredoxin--NADP+ reductase